MAIPPRARAMGFSISSLWVLPGLLILPIVGGLGNRWALPTAMLLMLPVFVLGGLIISTAGSVIMRDITQVWTTAAARSEVAYERRAGTVEAAPRPEPRRELQRRAGALRREPRGRRGRDHRPARHQRRRQVHAAQDDLGHRRSRPRGDHLRRRRHDRHPAGGDRRARRAAGAGRGGDVPLAHGAGEPRGRQLAPPARHPRARGRHRAGARAVPGPRHAPGTSRPPTSRAASSSSWRWRWRSCPSRAC